MNRAEITEQGERVFAEGFLKAVNDALGDIKRSYFFIGFRLDEASRLRYYESFGYNNIIELAEAEFGFKRATTYGLIQVYNYARGGETAMSMSLKFDKYGYTQLLEMSKAKTVTKNLITTGIERILTPKVTVAKIKELRPKWDKYISEHGKLPECNTVEEFEELVKAEETPAPAPLIELAGQTEREENPVQLIGLNESDEEFEAELEEPAGDEDFSQHRDEAVVKRSEDEIIRIGLTGVDIYVKDAKFSIYDKCWKTTDFSAFIKSVYNYDNKPNFTHGFYSKADNMNRCYEEKGIQLISFDPHQTVRMTWDEVARNISELIREDVYLTDEEKKEYEQWKAEKRMQEVSSEAVSDKEVMSDDKLVRYCLRDRAGFQNSKLYIYEKVLKGDFTTNEFIEFVKQQYSNGGWSGDDVYEGINTDSKGLEIKRKTGGKLILSWSIVAGRIKRLIENNDYLKPEEQNRYPHWKAEREGLAVNVAETGTVEDLERVKPDKLDLKNEKARREWLENFRAWGVWLEVPQVDKKFYRYDFVNGCALIIEVGFEYWDAWSTNKGAHERVSYSMIDKEHPKFNSKGESYTDTLKWLTNHAKEI